MKWYQSGESALGVVLVIHGLNLKPEKMIEIIGVLNEIHLDVLLLSLRGHGDNHDGKPGQPGGETRLAAFKRVTGRVWLEEVQQAYITCLSRADALQCPVYFVGYSLGGLLGCNLLLADNNRRIEKMFLFSPAITTHRVRVPFFRLLHLFPRIVIPSLSPEDYRSNRGTPIAAYLALLEIIRRFKYHLNGTLNIPTVVVIDRNDELVSCRKLKKLIQRNHLRHWTIYHIKRSPNQLKIPYRHLIIDARSTGSENWKIIREMIINHFKIQ